MKKANVVFFTGGDQIRLTSILGGSLFFDIIKERLSGDSKFIYAGTSAGAAAASPADPFIGLVGAEAGVDPGKVDQRPRCQRSSAPIS